MLKRLKVIESDSSLVDAYSFRMLEIQMIRCNGQWKVEGTVATVHTITQGG